MSQWIYITRVLHPDYQLSRGDIFRSIVQQRPNNFGTYETSAAGYQGGHVFLHNSFSANPQLLYLRRIGFRCSARIRITAFNLNHRRRRLRNMTTVNMNTRLLALGLATIAAIVAAGVFGLTRIQSADTPSEATDLVQIDPTPIEPDPLASTAGFGIGPEPTNVQGVVNRVHAIVVARITSFDGARSEGPYVNGVLTDAPTPVPGRPSVAFESGYFSFEVEKILLDDGFVADAPSFRGVADQDHRANPDVGERYILSLFRNPDNRSYGAMPTFGLIELSDGKATRQDGLAFRFEGPTGEEALIKAFEEAIKKRRAITFGEWREPYADLPLNAD